MPDGASGPRIEGEYLIRTGDIHHAIDDYRSDFEHLMIDRKNPFELQVADIRCIDLVQRAVAIAADVSVIGGPVAGLRIGDLLE